MRLWRPDGSHGRIAYVGHSVILLLFEYSFSIKLKFIFAESPAARGEGHYFSAPFGFYCVRERDRPRSKSILEPAFLLSQRTIKFIIFYCFLFCSAIIFRRERDLSSGQILVGKKALIGQRTIIALVFHFDDPHYSPPRYLGC
jgi:hypothetical protein